VTPIKDNNQTQKSVDAPPTLEYIHSLPKVELHCHLDGSIRLNTLIELAQQNKIKLPSFEPAELKQILKLGQNYDSLEDYLKVFDYTLSVMQGKDELYRTAWELAEDAAAENCRHIEVRYSPILHIKQGLGLTEVMEAVLQGLADAGRKFNIHTGVIVCGIRNINPETSMRLAELSVAYKNRGVVGFDLAGAEHNFPAKDHVEAFYLIHNNNINCTVHAGEAYGPESIHQALHYLNAHRIGHGTRLKEDGDLLNFVNDHRIPIEMCPTSNVQTNAVPSLSRHPLDFYLDFGVRVTVNTDNRLMSDTTVSEELYRISQEFGLSRNEVKKIILNGFKSAFMHHQEKSRMIESALAEMGHEGKLIGY